MRKIITVLLLTFFLLPSGVIFAQAQTPPNTYCINGARVRFNPGEIKGDKPGQPQCVGIVSQGKNARVSVFLMNSNPDAQRWSVTQCLTYCQAKGTPRMGKSQFFTAGTTFRVDSGILFATSPSGEDVSIFEGVDSVLYWNESLFAPAPVPTAKPIPEKLSTPTAAVNPDYNPAEGAEGAYSADQAEIPPVPEELVVVVTDTPKPTPAADQAATAPTAIPRSRMDRPGLTDSLSNGSVNWNLIIPILLLAVIVGVGINKAPQIIAAFSGLRSNSHSQTERNGQTNRQASNRAVALLPEGNQTVQRLMKFILQMRKSFPDRYNQVLKDTGFKGSTLVTMYNANDIEGLKKFVAFLKGDTHAATKPTTTPPSARAVSRRDPQAEE